MSVLTLEAKLERTDKGTPWGFRMQGGKDYASALTIQRVTPGSLAAKCGLQAGDIILKIGNAAAETMKHKEAQDIIVACTNRLDLLLQRGGSSTPQQAYDKFPVSQFGSPASSSVQPGFSSQQNFNTAPKPFGTPTSSTQYSGVPGHPNYGGQGVNSLSQQTQNMSISSNQPSFMPSAQKYTERETAPDPTQNQSKSFRFLQGLMDSGQEQTSQEPIPPWISGGGTSPGQAAAKPATWSPSQPAQPVQSAAAAKPWAPPAPAPSGPPAARQPPKPSGVGATRGKKGDAVIRQQGATGIDIPRTAVCASCGSTIRGPFVVAMGKTWCPDHFVCANSRCATKLIDIGFVEEGGYLYCERDYELYFAPKCEKCKVAIVGECVNALNKSYHPACFLCFHCKQPIGGNQFHIEDGNAYCEKDWNVMFQTMCSGCNFPIEPGDRWVEAMGKNFHSECFNCSTCQVSLEGAPFYVKAGKPFCKKHVR